MCYKFKGKFRIEETTTGTEQVCNRTTSDGILECSSILIHATSDNDLSGIRYAETVATAPDLFDGWSTMAGIMTVTETQAKHIEIYARLYGPHESMTVFYDDISIKPLPRMCGMLVLNGDFEVGDTRFWLPSDKGSIDVDVSSFGANNSNYSMMITKYTTDRLRQKLDTRCLIEGQEFLIRAKFKLVSSTDTSTGIICDPLILNEREVTACPSVTIRGEDCVVDGTLRYTFWNEKSELWDANSFNEYEKLYSVDADMAACQVSIMFSGYN